MTTVVYSQRLGAISDAQLEAAARRLGVGRFVAAEPIRGGLFGQNLFLTTTEGQFVLRGAPHWVNGAPNDQWQFTKEGFFAGLLHARTDVPVPWPQHYDPTSDIFGWPYVIVPRLPGLNLDDRAARASLSRDDQIALARALGRGLGRLHALRWPVAGEIDEHCRFAAYPSGFLRHIVAELELMRGEAQLHGALTTQDQHWIAEVIEAALIGQPAADGATYVHADYKLDNLVVDHPDGEWAVCGVFDLHTSCFGDAAYDLCRTVCSYLDRDMELARAFVGAWRERSGSRGIDLASSRLFLTNERMKIWEYFTRPGHRADWTRRTTFTAFVTRYDVGLEHLLA